MTTGGPAEATFTGNLGLIKDTYTVAYDWAETEVSWHLTKGEMLHDLHGTYTCTDLGDGTTAGRVLPGRRARRARDRDAAPPGREGHRRLGAQGPEASGGGLNGLGRGVLVLGRRALLGR